MKLSKNNYKKLAIEAAKAGDSKKAENVRIFDLCGRSTLADFVVLMTVESAPQLEAVEEEVSVRLKQEGVYCLHKDGARSKTWKVLDFSGVIVHVFDAKSAELYSLEKIYAEAEPVAWEEAPAPKAAPKAAAKEIKPAVKTAVKKTVVKKAAAKKPAVKKAAAKKPAAKKPAVKKAAVKKPAVKKAALKKAAVKKTVSKKTAVKKAPARKNAGKKAALKKSAVKKTAAKKPAIKKNKTAAKKKTGKK